MINDPSKYDLLIIGTPVWGGHVFVPVRTYIQQQANFQKCCFFCTANGNKFDVAFNDMKELCRVSPIATLGVRAIEIKNKSFDSKMQEFIKGIQM